jgi:hypothetical protein
MSDITGFNPLYTNTSPAGTSPGTLQPSVTLAASTTATAGLLPGGNSSTAQIEFANLTGAWAFINLGIAGAVVPATVAASYPIAPGADKVISVPSEVTGWSVILQAGAAAGSVIATRGSGL